MNFSAKLNGADNIQLGIRNLGKALPEIMNADVNKAMKLAAKMSVPYQGGNSYDVPETGGPYIRTGNLGRSVMVYQRGPSTVIEAKAYRRGREYTNYVIGDREGQNQAWMHVGRWTPMRDAVDVHLALLVDTTDEDIQRAIDKELGY
jgi:hypothetical protein